MDVASDVLYCPAEIVVHIVGGCRERLGSRDGCNISKHKPFNVRKQ